MLGLTAPAVIGLVGLGTEAGLWYLTRVQAQQAADFAARGGATRLYYAQNGLGLSLGQGKQQALDAATNTASQNGFTAGPGVTVNVNVPPQSPSVYNGDNTAVQVVIQ